MTMNIDDAVVLKLTLSDKDAAKIVRQLRQQGITFHFRSDPYNDPELTRLPGAADMPGASRLCHNCGARYV